MDCRTTLGKNETFLAVLENCRQSGAKAAMLLDVNGLVRAEGFVERIVTETNCPYVELTSGMKVAVHTISALNGIFCPAYSEC